MSFKRYRIIFILIFMILGSFGDQTKHDMENAQSAYFMPNLLIEWTENAQEFDNKEGRALFPRPEYTNEWQPVNDRGDPLKDPTYDYMPPVLDRVRYWSDGVPQKNKNDVLILGVPSKKLSAIKPKDKLNYGPIKRTYYSPPYQSHFSSPHHHHQQHQQPYLPQRMMPPPKHVTDSFSLSTHHYQNNQHHEWKTSNNVYSEPQPENLINYVRLSRPLVTTVRPPPPTLTTARHPSFEPFLPTIPPADRSQEAPSTSPTKPMSTKTTVKHSGHMSRTENARKNTTKPLLQSILQTETASPFTKKPSSVYQIEYTSNNIYSPEAINSMATSSSHATTFISTKPTLRPLSIKTTVKTSLVPSSSTTLATTTSEQEEQKQHYILPDMPTGWPVYNLVIEGHSKVKTYGLKSEDDQIKSNLPKIRPIQAKQNPVVEQVNYSEEGPKFNFKHLKPNKKDHNKFSKKTEEYSAMTSLLSLLDTSFGNFLLDESADKVRHESEKKIVKNEKEISERRKTRRSVPDVENNNQDFSVSFQVDDTVGNERINYHKFIAKK